MRMPLLLPASLGIALAGLALSATAISAADQASGDKVYELRIYKTNPGKLPALHARFRDHTCKLFQKHGIELVGFWTPTQGPEAEDTLYYIVAFPSVEAAKESLESLRERSRMDQGQSRIANQWRAGEKRAEQEHEGDGLLAHPLSRIEYGEGPEKDARPYAHSAILRYFAADSQFAPARSCAH